MINLNYEIEINRSIDFVYENIFKKEVYQKWTSAFAPSAYYIGEFKKDSPIRFLDDTNNGIGGVVIDAIKNELVKLSLEYEVQSGEKVDLLEKGSETYEFISLDDNKTLIKVSISYQDNYYDIMHDMWQIACSTIKDTLENA